MHKFIRIVLIVLFIIPVFGLWATVNVDVQNSNQSSLNLKIISDDFQINKKKIADGEVYNKNKS